jgi:phenylalanyl-tRNA synthetase beta chain
MRFSYNWLQSFFDKKLPKPEKLAEVLTMHSFETKAEKDILDIDVLPNRAHDCFSHLGIAKEISCLFNLPFKKEQKADFEISKTKVEDYLKLEVKEPDLCRRYIAGIITGIKVGPSPSWLSERLTAVGQRPINNIVDAANYVMFEMGQPLHAFDLEKIESVNPKSQIPNLKQIPNHKFQIKKIIVRKAEKGEKITTLDDKNYELDESMLVIADTKVPLAIAGIKGGKKAGIDKKTRNIIIESANFEPVNIRSTSRKLGLATGASAGFENEISPALALSAMDRIMDLIQEVAGGERIADRIDFYPKKIASSRIPFKASDVSKLLGVEIGEKEIISILNRLGVETKKTTRLPARLDSARQARQEGTIIADCPPERLDLNRKEDIIEEIARVFGYEKISSKVPEGLLIPVKRNDGYFYGDVIKNILAGAGFSEVYNYSFGPIGEIEIENPIAEDKRYLKANLIDGLMANVRNNFKYFDDVKIFEIGKIFKKSVKNPLETGVEEKNMLAGVISYKNPRKKEDEFVEAKGVVEMMLSKLGIDDFWFDDVFSDTGLPKMVRLDSARLADIKIGEEIIGILGLNYFEIDLGKLIDFINEEVEYRPVSKYPAVIRDIAVLVPQKTKVIEVLDIIENTAGELLMDTDLFDIYEGEELGGKKNLAFHLIFQSKEKTLSDKDVNILVDKIIKALEGKPGWQIRK